MVPSIQYPAFTIYEPCGWHTRPMCAVTWRAERARGKFSSKSSKVSKPAQIGRILKTPKSRRLQTARISKIPFEAGEVARFSQKVLKFVGAQNPRGTLCSWVPPHITSPLLHCWQTICREDGFGSFTHQCS